jgi:four helix bundle protein
MPKEYNLDARLLQFALRIIATIEGLPDTRVCNHLGGQLLRSGTSAALNYGEAQAAESHQDFIHKFKVILKELRESFMSLRILKAKSLLNDVLLVDETEELIAIFVVSLRTAKRNQKMQKS